MPTRVRPANQTEQTYLGLKCCSIIGGIFVCILARTLIGFLAGLEPLGALKLVVAHKLINIILDAH